MPAPYQNPAMVSHPTPSPQGEVLLASFFLQLFALLTPLFFQVVTDKILVHRGITTLQVLALGMLALSGFEALLGGLRTYLFSHTSNRIDIGAAGASNWPPRSTICCVVS
jgi:ABC-type bacteriocin/lantibiotic exporter with double-glycine peptidase domain